MIVTKVTLYDSVALTKDIGILRGFPIDGNQWKAELTKAKQDVTLKPIKDGLTKEHSPKFAYRFTLTGLA